MVLWSSSAAGTTFRASEQCAGEGAECRAEGAAERGEKSRRARGVGADVEQLRGNSQGTAEQAGVHAIKSGDALQRSHLPVERGVGEGQLVLLRGAGRFPALRAGQLIGEFAEAGGVARARQAVRRGLLQRVEGAGERAERPAGDRSFVGRGQAGIVENILILRQQDVARLSKLRLKLLIESVRGRALLIGCSDGRCLCFTSHGGSPFSLRCQFLAVRRPGIVADPAEGFETASEATRD